MFKANKALAAVGSLFFFSFGALSVSFAARGALTPGLHRHVKSHRLPEDRLAQVDRKTLKRGTLIEGDGDMLFEEEGERAGLPPDFPAVKRTAEFHLDNWQTKLTFRTHFAPKVSTNILQSVLTL